MRVSILTLALVGLVAWSAPSWAGSCCWGKAKAEGKASLTVCSELTAGMNLSDEQKAKISEIEASCQEAGSTPEVCAKSRDEIRALLTEEQKSEFDAAFQKACKKRSGCHADSDT